MSKPFKPGDQVLWWKQENGKVVPVHSTVLAVTAKRVKIETREDGENVVRHVTPRTLAHGLVPPSAEQGPSKATDAGNPIRSGQQPASGRSKRSGQPPVRPVLRQKPREDEAREDRIAMEIVVDAYDRDERVMGWQNYLEDKLEVPFRARCIEEREVSPLAVGDEVEVVGMASERECQAEMFVSIDWGERTLAVPLAQLEVVDATAGTREAVEDWHYWLAMGHEF